MSNLKVSGTLAIIAVSAITAQTNEKMKVNINTDLVDMDIKSEVDDLLSDKRNHMEIFSNLVNLSEMLMRDDTLVVKNLDALLASQTYNASNRDSTSLTGTHVTNPNAVQCYANCYSNCHSACHGSRGWR